MTKHVVLTAKVEQPRSSIKFAVSSDPEVLYTSEVQKHESFPMKV